MREPVVRLHRPMPVRRVRVVAKYQPTTRNYVGGHWTRDWNGDSIRADDRERGIRRSYIVSRARFPRNRMPAQRRDNNAFLHPSGIHLRGSEPLGEFIFKFQHIMRTLDLSGLLSPILRKEYEDNSSTETPDRVLLAREHFSLLQKEHIDYGRNHVTAWINRRGHLPYIWSNRPIPASLGQALEVGQPVENIVGNKYLAPFGTECDIRRVSMALLLPGRTGIEVPAMSTEEIVAAVEAYVLRISCVLEDVADKSVSASSAHHGDHHSSSSSSTFSSSSSSSSSSHPYSSSLPPTIPHPLPSSSLTASSSSSISPSPSHPYKEVRLLEELMNSYRNGRSLAACALRTKIQALDNNLGAKKEELNAMISRAFNKHFSSSLLSRCWLPTISTTQHWCEVLTAIEWMQLRQQNSNTLLAEEALADFARNQLTMHRCGNDFDRYFEHCSVVNRGFAAVKLLGRLNVDRAIKLERGLLEEEQRQNSPLFWLHDPVNREHVIRLNSSDLSDREVAAGESRLPVLVRHDDRLDRMREGLRDHAILTGDLTFQNAIDYMRLDNKNTCVELKRIVDARRAQPPATRQSRTVYFS